MAAVTYFAIVLLGAGLAAIAPELVSSRHTANAEAALCSVVLPEDPWEQIRIVAQASDLIVVADVSNEDRVAVTPVAVLAGVPPEGEFSIAPNCMGNLDLSAGERVLLFLQWQPGGVYAPTNTPFDFEWRPHNFLLSLSLDGAVVLSVVHEAYQLSLTPEEAVRRVATIIDARDEDTEHAVASLQGRGPEAGSAARSLWLVLAVLCAFATLVFARLRTLGRKQQQP